MVRLVLCFSKLYLKRCLGSNYHCSLCRKVINWMALRSECSGLAANTAPCREKAEKARKCPDLTVNFDTCWAHMQTCTENEGIQDGFISRKNLRNQPIFNFRKSMKV